MKASVPDLAPQVCLGRAAHLWQRSHRSVWIYVVILAALGAATPLAAEHPVVYSIALAAQSVAGLIRWSTIARRTVPRTPEEARNWLRAYGRHTLSAAAIWGCFAAFLAVAYGGSFLHYCALILSVGFACASVGGYAGHRALSLAYTVFVLGPVIGATAAGANLESAVLVFLLALLFAVTQYQISELNAWFVRSTLESTALEKARQEAEAATRIKSEFLANMSHELRTPMNGVMGTLDLLLQGRLDREQEMLARVSHRSAAALLDILNDILDFSKMNAGKLDFVSREFLLRNAVEDVFELLAVRALEKGVDLGYRIHPGVPECVVGDEGRLRQVIINLVSNSIKFSLGGTWPAGGSVLVEVALLSQVESRVRLSFTVTDSGPGMEPEALSRLFQPFMQADSSHSRRFGGTGLGLAISRQLVEAMGGSISAVSEPGKGASFSFDIVLGLAGATAAPPMDAPARTVLVVEPAPLSRATLGELLLRHGVAPVLTANPEQALRHLERSRPDCIVCPAQFLPAIAAAAPQPQPPAVVLSHRGESLPVVLPLDSGIRLTRPVRSAEIGEALAGLASLARRAAQPPSPAPAPSLSGHVLIAEDNRVNQMLAERLVVSLGLTAEVVPNGRAAIEALASKTFSLVLMDCQMPEMDGYEATRRLRATPAASRIPIVAMTANAMKGDKELCLAAGMDDYISKPIRLDRLRDVLSRYLAAGRGAGGAASS